MANTQAIETVATEKNKNEEQAMSKQTSSNSPERNIVADGLSQFLMIAIIYGVPVLLLLFGLYYIWGALQTDLNAGVRSLAAALLPLVVTLAFYKSQIRHNAVVFLSEKRWVAFGFSFAMAMAAASIAMLVRSSGSGIPVGELAFSATLALMVFGNDNSNEISYLHVGTVSGFLTYIIVFGLAI
jgi:cation transport ATPase